MLKGPFEPRGKYFSPNIGVNSCIAAFYFFLAGKRVFVASARLSTPAASLCPILHISYFFQVVKSSFQLKI